MHGGGSAAPRLGGGGRSRPIDVRDSPRWETLRWEPWDTVEGLFRNWYIFVPCLAQLISYLRLSNKRVGLLMNFNVLHLRDGMQRFVN